MILAFFSAWYVFSYPCYPDEAGEVARTRMNSPERRLYVRENFSFSVNFRVLTPDEYAKVRRVGQPSQSVGEGAADIADNDKTNGDIGANACLIDFLLQMDEKLDRIVALLSGEPGSGGLVNRQGIGINISGAGMSMLVDEPLEPGQIMQARFFLSKSPLVFMSLCGEVAWATREEENGKTAYHLGVTFLDLSPGDRERIIACVFQRQREALRRRKSQGDDIRDS
jgi:hypothetical protein